jgi:hypothetical protein
MRSGSSPVLARIHVFMRRAIARPRVSPLIMKSSAMRQGSRQALYEYCPSLGFSRKLAGAGAGFDSGRTMKSGSRPVCAA